jgi:hypothetical protein
MMTNQQKRIFHKKALLISQYRPDNFVGTNSRRFNSAVLLQAKKMLMKTRDFFFGSTR